MVPINGFVACIEIFFSIGDALTINRISSGFSPQIANTICNED